MMSLVLIIGSHVASSRVGGTLISLALAASPFDIEPIHVPTTLLGRHPGWGPPGGGGVSGAIFEGMLEGIAANGLFANVDAVLTNYFADAHQVVSTARAIDAIKAANPSAIIVVDPVIGDLPHGQYVSDDIAASILQHLVPRADFLTPNLWELGAMTGCCPVQEIDIIAAARQLGKVVLVTSVIWPNQIGAMLVDRKIVTLCSHEHLPNAPKGTGDLLAALFTGHLLQSEPPPIAMAKALGGVRYLVEVADEWGNCDLPIVSAGRDAWLVEPLDSRA
jgi:pyridoxine kinase